MTDEELTAFLHTRIPLTRSMGLELRRGPGGELLFEAPLALNDNHLGTAFGGSLNALAIVAGYTTLWLRLGDPAAHVIIQASNTRFLAPVTGHLCAEAGEPDPAALETFLRRYGRKGVARISIPVVIRDEAGKPAVLFEGVFVAQAAQETPAIREPSAKTDE